MTYPITTERHQKILQNVIDFEDYKLDKHDRMMTYNQGGDPEKAGFVGTAFQVFALEYLDLSWSLERYERGGDPGYDGMLCDRRIGCKAMMNGNSIKAIANPLKIEKTDNLIFGWAPYSPGEREKTPFIQIWGWCLTQWFCDHAQQHREDEPPEKGGISLPWTRLRPIEEYKEFRHKYGGEKGECIWFRPGGDT